MTARGNCLPVQRRSRCRRCPARGRCRRHAARTRHPSRTSSAGKRDRRWVGRAEGALLRQALRRNLRIPSFGIGQERTDDAAGHVVEELDRYVGPVAYIKLAHPLRAERPWNGSVIAKQQRYEDALVVRRFDRPAPRVVVESNRAVGSSGRAHRHLRRSPEVRRCDGVDRVVRGRDDPRRRTIHRYVGQVARRRANALIEPRLDDDRDRVAAMDGAE